MIAFSIFTLNYFHRLYSLAARWREILPIEKTSILKAVKKKRFSTDRLADDQIIRIPI